MPKIKLKKIEVHEPRGPRSIEEGPMMSAPSFYINAKQMPEIKDWEVGEKYRLVIEVKQVSKEERDESTSASLDILAYKYLKEKTPEDMTDEEFEIYQGEMLSKR